MKKLMKNLIAQVHNIALSLHYMATKDLQGREDETGNPTPPPPPPPPPPGDD